MTPSSARSLGEIARPDRRAARLVFPDARRIAVLRPSAVGDFICALPALTALRETYPQAQITLLGKAWHARFLENRPGPVDRVVVLPAVRGVGEPADCPEDSGAIERFLLRMREYRFDIALQLHGGGRYSNPFVQQLGARATVGLRAPGSWPLERWIPYQPMQNERLRLLEAVALTGARTAELDPPLALTPADRRELSAAFPEADGGGFVVLHPGASDPRRRWPARHFAAVGDTLSAQGLRVVLHGGEDERGLCASVAERMRAPAIDLSGRLSLGALAALLASARLLVSNDTGPLHLAHAVGAPSVGVYWLVNALVYAPLVQARHRAAVSPRILCPECGAENLLARCPHDPSFVEDVPPEQVIALARELLQQ